MDDDKINRVKTRTPSLLSEPQELSPQITVVFSSSETVNSVNMGDNMIGFQVYTAWLCPRTAG